MNLGRMSITWSVIHYYSQTHLAHGLAYAPPPWC
jgi:hypothetical protein